MRLTNREIGDIVFGAFKKAFEEKDKGQLKKSNRFRSAYFVSLIGDKLKTHFKGATTYYQSIESIDEKGKKSGEWLFDVCVTSQLKIRDDRKGKRKPVAAINTNILFACESEFDTSLDAFTVDFGKLLCSNANQWLFVQGLKQKSKTGRKSFIESRQEVIKNQLEHLISDDFVLAFIPTPGKVEEGSFWDVYGKEVLKWASIWAYNASENEFFEIVLEKKEF